MYFTRRESLLIVAIGALCLGACASHQADDAGAIAADTLANLALDTVVAPNTGNKTRQEIVPGESAICDQACVLRKKMLLASQKEENERQQRRQESDEFRQEFSEFMASPSHAEIDQNASAEE